MRIVITFRIIQWKYISFIVDREIIGPEFLKPLHDVLIIQGKEQVCGNRDIVGTYRNVNCLLKITSIKHTK
jgi:hypothetical protein